MAKETYYITSPIYYPNDKPHLGHAYTTIAADVLSRWNALQGKEVFFLTGTDEHGKKIEEAAEKAGKPPKEFVDSLVPEFKSAWKKLNIKYNRFIRTTDKDHEKLVKETLQKVYDSGDIYLGSYKGLYCTSCEDYKTTKELEDTLCKIHDTKVQEIEEESYFFKLSKYEDFLLDLFENSDFIQPKAKRNEMISFIKTEGLKDLSISRTSFDWGIPFPFDKKHITYVWFDALLNYYTATQKSKELNKFWPADLHIIGKDIIRQHTIYWPAMLKSAGLPIPKKVFAHGWWTVNNKKMGKSAGNAVSVDDLIEHGADSARYFLLRETPFGNDGDFSSEALASRHNDELADKLGNLVSRVSTLAEKYGIEETNVVALNSEKTRKSVTKNLSSLQFDKALQNIFAYVDNCNAYVNQKEPWKTEDPKVLYELANGIKDTTILLSPFIPETAEKIAKTFNFSLTLSDLQNPLKVSKIKKSEILFKKIS